MRSATYEDLVRQGVITTEKREPERPDYETDPKRLRALLRSEADLEQQRRQLLAEIADIQANRDQVINSAALKITVLQAEMDSLAAETDQVNRAKKYVLDQSQPTERERELEREHQTLLHKIPELQLRYSLPARGKDPAEHYDVKKLAELQSQIADLDKQMARNTRGVSGCSWQERLRRKLQGEVDKLEPRVAILQQRWEQYRKLAPVRDQAEKIRAEREQLRTERETAALAAAMK